MLPIVLGYHKFGKYSCAVTKSDWLQLEALLITQNLDKTFTILIHVGELNCLFVEVKELLIKDVSVVVGFIPGEYLNNFTAICLIHLFALGPLALFKRLELLISIDEHDFV